METSGGKDVSDASCLEIFLDERKFFADERL
jgi:hypothetical protein